MSIIQNIRPEIDNDHSLGAHAAIHTAQKWPDRHPRSKARACTICGSDARLYTCGPRCDNHRPRAGAS